MAGTLKRQRCKAGFQGADCYAYQVQHARPAKIFRRSSCVSVNYAAFVFLFSLIFSVLFLSGCRQHAKPEGIQQPTPRQLQQQQARALAKNEATARASLEEIPPPLKHRYIDVHSTDAWQNPFLTVHRDTLTLRVIFPQQTTSALDAGTLLHPAGARRQELEIRMSDLPEALSAVPDFSWPYGRVVAIEESPTASRQDRAQIRRNVEQAIRIVNDLDVVVDEWTPGGNGLLH